MAKQAKQLEAQTCNFAQMLQFPDPRDDFFMDVLYLHSIDPETGNRCR